MLMRRLCGSGMGSSEQEEYCSSVFCSDLDRLNRDINYLLYFTYVPSTWPLPDVHLLWHLSSVVGL